MSLNKYRMSFTTGGLFYQESIKILSEYLVYQDWSKTQEKVLADNLLQQKTINSGKRIFSEVVIRLKNLPGEYLNILKTGSKQDQLIILWISACRSYQFIGDFARQVLREKYLGLDYQLNYKDYNKFYNSQMDWHQELESYSENTRVKQKQVLFRMLKEASLISDNKTILRLYLSKETIRVIYNTCPEDFGFIPLSEYEIKENING